MRNSATKEKPMVLSECPCRHHWLIETPDGPVARGVCKLCNARGSFLTVMPEPKRPNPVYHVPMSRFYSEVRGIDNTRF